jgi:hypothetical protein
MRPSKTYRRTSKLTWAVWGVAQLAGKTVYLFLLLFSANNGRSTLFAYLTALTVPSQKMGPVTLHTLIAHETPILSSCRQSSWISPRFSALQYRLFWKLTANIRETRPLPIETLSVDLLHCAQDWKTQFKKCILAVGSCSFKAWTAVFVCGRSCDNCVALLADVFATLIAWSSLLRDFRGGVSIVGQISSNFSSVSTVDFSLASCLAVILLFLGLLTTSNILRFLWSGFPGNWQRNFLRRFQADLCLQDSYN